MGAHIGSTPRRRQYPDGGLQAAAQQEELSLVPLLTLERRSVSLLPQSRWACCRGRGSRMGHTERARWRGGNMGGAARALALGIAIGGVPNNVSVGR